MQKALASPAKAFYTGANLLSVDSLSLAVRAAVLSVVFLLLFLLQGALFAQEAEYYDDGGYAEDEYADDYYDDGGYAEDEYADDGYDDGGYAEDEYADDYYDDGGYAEDEYADDYYDDGGYAEDEYADDYYDDGGYTEDEYADDYYDDGGYAEDEYADDYYDDGGYAEDEYADDYYDDGGYAEDEYADDYYDDGGYAEDEYADDGYDDGGYAEDEYADDGYDDGGYAEDEYADDGYDDGGYAEDEYADEGYDDGGYAEDEYADDGYDDGGYAEDEYGHDLDDSEDWGAEYYYEDYSDEFTDEELAAFDETYFYEESDYETDFYGDDYVEGYIDEAFFLEASDCFDDERYDSINRTCVLICQGHQCDLQQQEIAQATDALGEDYFSGNRQVSFRPLYDSINTRLRQAQTAEKKAPTEEELVIYALNNGEIELKRRERVRPELQALADDTRKHHLMWDRFKALVPPAQVDFLTEVTIFTDGANRTTAFVEPTTANTNKWTLAFDVVDSFTVDDQLDIQDFPLTLLHEFGHLLFLNAKQTDSLKSTRPSKEELKKVQAKCAPNYFSGIQCAKTHSYANRYWQKFWKGRPKPDTRSYDFVADQANEFVSTYARTNPDDDMADTFVRFLLLNEKPQDTSLMVNQKILFFHDFPELVRLREVVRARIRHVYAAFKGM